MRIGGCTTAGAVELGPRRREANAAREYFLAAAERVGLGRVVVLTDEVRDSCGRLLRRREDARDEVSSSLSVPLVYMAGTCEEVRGRNVQILRLLR